MGNLKPQELWALNPLEFNTWRRENDLKDLLIYFQKTLPHFDEWLTENQLTIDFILQTDKTGNFFYWDKEVYLCKTIKETVVSYFFIPIENKKHEKQIESNKTIVFESEQGEYYKFKPYFLWVKWKYKLDKPIKTNYSGDLETFRYINSIAPDVPELSTEVIAPGITVLKLGGVKIEGWGNLNRRNLDFTNLDFLEIEGKYSLNDEIQIFYASCKNVKLINADAKFSKFYQSEFANLSTLNSRLYGIEFYNCNIFKAYFENTNISNLMVANCCSNNFYFNRVEVENFEYIPPKKEYHCNIDTTYKTISENYKRLRMLFQSNGHQQEVSKAFYYERFYEMKYSWGETKFLQSFLSIWEINKEYGISALKNNFKTLSKSIFDYISFSIWGFGERPKRIFTSTLFLIFFYSIIYKFSDITIKLADNLVTNLDWVNSIYFSIVTFTTLGLGDITPLHSSDNYKLIVGSEALVGAFFMGLIVAGFANKSRY